MSASSSSSLPVPPISLLISFGVPSVAWIWKPMWQGPGAGRARGSTSVSAMMFFEFQKAYVRRMTTYQIARAQQQAGVLHLQMHAHPAGNMAHPANQAPLQANQGQNQQPAAPEAVLLNQIFRPVAASASGSHALGAEAFILAASNIMLTLLVLLFVVAIYFGGGN
ncbi:hypothetical protein VPH35_081413 [Triticum aestivum]